MKNLRTRILILCGLMVLSAAALAPIVVQAGCPQVIISCSDGSQHSCKRHTCRQPLRIRLQLYELLVRSNAFERPLL